MTKRDSDLQSQGHADDNPHGEPGTSPEPVSPLESSAEPEAAVAEGEASGTTAAPGQAVAEVAGAAAREADVTAALRAEIEKLKAELQEKVSLLQNREREATELKDKYLRALAESENTRRRMRQQNEETVRREREAILRDLLPIADNLERAVEAARDRVGNDEIGLLANRLRAEGRALCDNTAARIELLASQCARIAQGVEMVLGSLLDFLRANAVTPVASVGQPFDPARHEAIDHVPSGVHPPNTVVEEAHRGYQIGDRVLRPARVVVAKGSDQAASSAGRKNGETQS